MAWTLQQYRDDPSLFRQFTHRQPVPCICGRCGAIHRKSKRVVYLNLANLSQEHFFCTRKCSGLRQRDRIGDGRVCRSCGVFTPTQRLWHHRGWTCTACAAKHPKFRYRTFYKARAVKAGLPFTISFQQFMLHWQKPCSYCGDDITTIGLDRVDNSRGYEPDNVVPCCEHCNALKGTNTLDEFLARCTRVATLHPGVS